MQYTTEVAEANVRRLTDVAEQVEADLPGTRVVEDVAARNLEQAKATAEAGGFTKTVVDKPTARRARNAEEAARLAGEKKVTEGTKLQGLVAEREAGRARLGELREERSLLEHQFGGGRTVVRRRLEGRSGDPG